MDELLLVSLDIMAEEKIELNDTILGFKQIQFEGFVGIVEVFF